MAVALKRFYKDNDAQRNHEMKIFRTCNDKIGRILLWKHKDENSIEELRELALSQGGLFNPSMRKRAWPALLGIRESCANVLLRDQDVVGDTKYLDIIHKDVHRSAMFRSKAVTGSVIKGEQESANLQRKLTTVLKGILARGADVNYYQGLHEVAFVLLQNMNYDEDATLLVLEKMLQTHLKDATRKDFSNITFVLDCFLMPLIHSFDLEVYQALVESEVPLSNAVLPWLVTLFSHPVQDEAVASRFMDAFIANPHPMLPFYVAVALLLHPAFRQQLLAATFDPAMMHIAIQGLPGQVKNDFVVGLDDAIVVTAQDVIESALDVMHQHPHESLLRFVGAGLKKRTRRRLLKKASGIFMLQIPVQTWSWKVQAQNFLDDHVVSKKEFGKSIERLMSSTTIVYNAATEKGCKALAVSKETVMALQILMLFLLMPQQYVQKFYCLLQVMLECLSPDWRSTSKRAEMKKNNRVKEETMMSTTTTTSYEERQREIPGMVKSDSATSISEMKDDPHAFIV